MRSWLPAFAAANAAALALVVLAGRQAWVESAGETRVPVSLIRLWLPAALALAAAITAAIGASLDERARTAFLRRHFALYLAAPLVLLLAFFGRPVLNGQVGAIYLLMAFVFAAHALHGIWQALDRAGDRRVALLAALTLLGVALMILPYHRTVQPTESDEPHYLLIMQSLVLDGDLDLRNDYQGDRYLDFYPAKLEAMHGIEVGNAVYPIRDLGLPLAAAIPFALGERTGVLAFLCLVGAALAYQVYCLLRDLRFDPRVALLAVAATAFTHPLLTYTSQVYPELLAALAFVTAARVLRAGARASAVDLAVASALVGALPWLTTRAWFVAIGVGLVIAYRAFRSSPADVGRRVRATRVAAGALPFAALVLLLCYVNWRMFDLFMPSAGYYLIRDQQEVLALAPQVGALGLFFDRVFGLVGRTPLYLLAFLGVGALVRRARAGHADELAALALGWVLSFLYIADIAYWWADGSPSSRYLVATMPFLAAAVAGGIEAIASARLRPVLAAAAWAGAAWSAFVMYAYAVQPTLAYDLAPEIRATGSEGRLWEYVGRAVRPDPANFFPSLVRVDAASIVLSLAWLALAAALVLYGWRAAPARAGPRTL